MCVTYKIDRDYNSRSFGRLSDFALSVADEPSVLSYTADPRSFTERKKKVYIGAKRRILSFRRDATRYARLSTRQEPARTADLPSLLLRGDGVASTKLRRQ